MTTPEKSRERHGFTIVSVTLLLSSLILLVTGLLVFATLDRKSADAVEQHSQARLAADSALEHATARLLPATARDDYFIVRSLAKDPSAPSYYYLALPPDSSDSTEHSYLTLFTEPDGVPATHTSKPPNTLHIPAAPNFSDSSDLARIELAPYLPPVSASWRYLRNEKGKPVARYAYHIEDRQRLLNLPLAGNLHGPDETHTRELTDTPGLPAKHKGLALEQAALYSLTPQGQIEDSPTSKLDNRLIAARSWITNGGSPHTSLGHPADSERNSAGRLVAPQARLLEENLATELQTYTEQPIIPHAPHIAPLKRGTPKLNLNSLLIAQERPTAVHTLASHINTCLPLFARTRQGGFPDHYTQTLAANALDYADKDSHPTLPDESLLDSPEQTPPYRGLDSYPAISEFLMRFRWEDVRTEEGRKIITLTAATYVELWNHTNQPISGEFSLTYETDYSFALGPNPEIKLGSPELLDSPATSHSLEKRGNQYYFPADFVRLAPNEFKVIKLGEVSYQIDTGPAFIFIPSPLVLEGDNLRSGYTALWNDRFIELTREPVNRYSATLHYPKDLYSKPRSKVRATIPGHSAGIPGSYVNNPGDSRIAYYLSSHQSANAYPRNYSPNRRNVRLGIREPESKIYARVLPSQWPDGGHDASIGNTEFKTGDQRLAPDAPRFMASPPLPDSRYAPTRLSNRGYFRSPTELGHLFDPVLWDQGAGSNHPAAFAEISHNAEPSPHHGGGNSLRIGRPEHPRFDSPGTRACDLLDLFHASLSTPTPSPLPSPTRELHALPNLNTAEPEVLRLLLAGYLVEDPLSATTGPWCPRRLSPIPNKWRLSSPTRLREADLIVDALVSSRPFACWSEVARIKDSSGRPVFGNLSLYRKTDPVQLNDAAREEHFARLMNSSTLRSRNFRIHIVAQALAPNGKPTATVRRKHDLFASPGQRSADGAIQPENTKIHPSHELPH